MTISVSSVLDQVRAEHRTEKYKDPGLIVRRGFPVRLETTSTSLTLRLVPAHPRNTTVLGYEFTVSVDAPSNEWSLEGYDEGIVMLRIPPNALVGMYAVQDDDSEITMAVLFNPFSEEDGVYMEDEEERNEYVLNDAGRIWVGSSPSPSGLPWSLAQFRATVMLCALHFLDSMPLEERHDPVKVTRHLSAVLNAQDENGVLVGRWDGEYTAGTSPSAWTGSAEILKQYWETLRPVSYGQCWVFSGVFTSVMRSLGIGSRCVTNFVSAHDTTKPYNRAVDKYYDSQGVPLEEISYDSVWNFHVWNSAWIVRPDLQEQAEEHGLDYGGWQVVDATPQEESSGLYQLGPAPLTGIKHGYTLSYDTDFVIGEVNADVIHYWKVEGTEDFEVREKFPRHIGQHISTKAVGRDERNDITLEYKFAEGTEEERASLANRPSSEIEPKEEPSADVHFAVDYPPDVRVGDLVRFVVRATNNGADAVTVRFNCLYRATDYTGTPRATIGESTEGVTVEAGQAGELVVEVLAEQYEPHLASGVQTIQFNSTAIVQETGQVWSFESLVRLNADDTLAVIAPESVELGEAVAATALITNITNTTLTNVILRAEGEGLVDFTVVELDAIAPGDTVEAEIALEPSEIGDKLLVTTLDTAELKDISRSVHIQVVDTNTA